MKLSSRCMLIVALSSLLITASPAVEQTTEAGPTKFTRLDLYPSQVSLNHHDDFQQLIAVATREDGGTLDVTQLADWRLLEEQPSSFELDKAQLTATSAGSAEIVAEFAGLRARTQAIASNTNEQQPASFRHDVMPIFLRAGCNSGGCHGSSRGKDGFRLSLFGFDPAGDFHRLTRELATRRLNYPLPDESLLLLKSTGAVPHTGGKRFERDSVYYLKLRQWIAEGATSDLADAAEVDSVELYPPSAVLRVGDQTQQFVVVANYSNGSTRDVTDLAIFQSSNDAVANIDPRGLLTSDHVGETFVMARFDTHTVGSQVLVLRTNQTFTPTEETPANYIDDLVSQKLRTMRINPSPICTDAEFLRRVTLDIAGRLPQPAELEQFLASDYPNKRAEKIDQLIASPDFTQLWTHKWAELLLIRTQPNLVETKPMYLYWQWLGEQIAASRPLDGVIRELLTASGTSFDTPPTNFFQIEPNTNKVAENVAQSFLGIRIQCAQCHNHPFDRWTMDDYYGFTAFFAQIARKRGEDYREQFIFSRDRGETKHPLDGRVMKPKVLGGAEPETKGRDRRAVLADWLVSPENPYFAPSIANRVWAHFFGHGIVEPVDDIRISNPPSNGALFDKLGSQLIEYDYDIRPLVRDICNSRTYQRSSDVNATNADDVANYARAQPRRLSAEVLLDCIIQATDKPQRLPGLKLGERALKIADGRASNYFLTTFGRAKRESVCACEATAEPTLSQALLLLNNGTVHKNIAQGGLISQWLAAGKSPTEVVEAIYLRCLSRPPTDQEREQLVGTLPTQETQLEAGLHDIFWAVLNSREFLFNH